MSRNRRFRRSLRRMIFAGLVAGAGFAPAAAAHVSPLGGPVASSQNPSIASTGFVAVGGDLVQRSQVGLYKHEVLGTQRSSIPAVTKVAKAASSTGFNWSATIIAVASVTAACLLLAAAFVVRRRVRLTPA
jgi:hypothetical protein